MWFRTLCVVMLGSVVAILADQPSSARYFNPRFAADGMSLIFESTREGKYAVYTINVDGTKLRKLTDGRQNDAQPQWSRDGRFITFTSDAGGVPKVHIMASDGRGARLVTSGPGNDQSPIFISNTRVVFTRDVPPGTNWLKLTPEDHTKRRASSEVMAVNIDGTALENLTQNDVLDGNASWASASQRIFFTSSRGGSQELFSMSADGSDVRRVMDATGIQPSVAFDGRQVTYTRLVGDRSAVVVHDLAIGREREVIGGDPPRPPA